MEKTYNNEIEQNAIKRVAIIIGGRSKLYDQHLSNQIKSLSNIYEVDTFFHLNEDFSQEKYDDIVYKCNAKKIKFEKYEIPEILSSYIYKRPETNKYNCFSMYYSNMKAFDLINEYLSDIDEDFKYYDYYIKFRPDIVSSYIPIIDLSNNEKSECKIYTPNDYHWFGISDQIAIGNYISMQKYCSLYNHLETYLLKDNIIIHPETLLKYHFDVQKITLEKFIYSYELDPMRK